MPFRAKKMMRRRAHRDYPARLAHQRLDRNVIEQVLQRPGEARPINRRRKHDQISRRNFSDNRCRIVAVCFQRSAVGECDAKIGKIENFGFHFGMALARGLGHHRRRFEEPARRRHAANYNYKFAHGGNSVVDSAYECNPRLDGVAQGRYDSQIG